MPKLHIALQEGFAHDPVSVSVAGVPVYRHADLSTRQQIGLAASFSTDVTGGDVALDIHVPGRPRRDHRFSIAVPADVWLGISIRPDGELVWRTSDAPFGYV